MRARAGARDAAAHQPRRPVEGRSGAAARGHGLPGPDAGVGEPRPGGPPGLADQAPRAAAGDDPRRRRAEDPVHVGDPGGHRRDAGAADRGAGGAGRGARRARPPPGGDPAELRAPPALPRRRAGADRGRGAALADRGRGRADARLGPGRDAGRDARAGARVAGADARRGRSDPAQPGRLVAAADRGGGHRPGRPVGERGPHLARAPVPHAAPDAQGAPAARLRADRAPVRVPAVHGLRVDGAGRAGRGQDLATGASSRGAGPVAATTARSARS